jgi:hypothetical protein
MKKEIRVFICDSESWYNSTPNADIEDAMDCAESQGTVLTLPEFIKQFNDGELTDLLSKNTVTINMAEFEEIAPDNYVFVKEIK